MGSSRTVLCGFLLRDAVGGPGGRFHLGSCSVTLWGSSKGGSAQGPRGVRVGVHWEGPSWSSAQGSHGSPAWGSCVGASSGVQCGGLGAPVGQQEPGGGGVLRVHGGMMLGMSREGSQGSLRDDLGRTRWVSGAEAMPGSAAPRQLPPHHPQATKAAKAAFWDLMGQGWPEPPARLPAWAAGGI